jgi:hypothetical protein
MLGPISAGMGKFGKGRAINITAYRAGKWRWWVEKGTGC